MPETINIITLGCSKNLTDSEELATQINASRFNFVFDRFDTNAKIVIINTCGFIADAKEESVDTILDFAQAKNKGDIKKLYVFGCLAERYKPDIEKEIPEADKIFGADNIEDILSELEIDYKKELLGERLISTPSHYAYLKISEGCNRKCAFCAIPLMRGKHRSKPIELLSKQAEYLAENGVKELILIAQELSSYGTDLYGEKKLGDLLRRLSAIKKIQLIRLHYAFPFNFPEDVLPVMQNSDKIAKYLDIPLQHISNSVLKRMRRGHTKESTLKLLGKIRARVPGIALRTTLLVGFPGESEKDFLELKQFVKQARFERLGVFSYSEEENTFAAEQYEDDVPEEVKQERKDEIMEVQQQISLEHNLAKKGSLQKVVIDSEDDEFYIGRTEFDSPEVDNDLLIKKGSRKLKKGEFYTVKITGAGDFELFAELV